MEIWRGLAQGQPDRLAEERARDASLRERFPPRRLWASWLLALLTLLVQTCSGPSLISKLLWGGSFPGLAYATDWWRLVSHGMVQQDWWGCWVQLGLLLLLGLRLEAIVGGWALLGVWGAGCAAGNLLSERMLPSTLITLAMDGGLWALAGSYLTFAVRRRRLPAYLRRGWPWGILLWGSVEVGLHAIGLDFFDHWAHLGGLVTGLALGLLPRRLSQLFGSATVACLLGALATRWLGPTLGQLPQRVYRAEAGRFSVSLATGLMEQEGALHGPGFTFLLGADLRDESDCENSDAEEAELFREGLMSWAAVTSEPDRRQAGLVWKVWFLRPHEDKDLAGWVAVTTHHESLYYVQGLFSQVALDEARPIFDQAFESVQTWEWSAGYYLGKARQLHQDGLHFQAWRVDQHAVALDPRNPRALTRLVLDGVYVGKAEMEPALRLEKIWPKSQPALRAQAYAWAPKDMERSRQLAARMLKMAEKSEQRRQAWHMLAWLEAIHGDPNRALKAVAQVKAAGGAPGLLDTEAAARLRLKQPEQALRCLEKADSGPAVHLHRGMALEALGRREEAVQEYQSSASESWQQSRTAREHLQRLQSSP
ncbi:MAG: rhomboid family intramembrane serine protease [Candidatus Eremiobacteraeota bacterium]|nr:rhomboid family intramembrane serine protease [Candidatus Eremiobacteraeota bacterium]